MSLEWARNHHSLTSGSYRRKRKRLMRRRWVVELAEKWAKK